MDIHDRRLAATVRRCRDLPGQELFAYLDDDGKVVPVRSDDVNEYLHALTGSNVTAKDFRTWFATVLCAATLAEVPSVSTPRRRKDVVVRAVAEVATRLRNTPAVCRKSYVHPAVIEGFLLDGRIRLPRKRRQVAPDGPGLDATETRVAHFLERAVKRAAAGAK